MANEVSEREIRELVKPGPGVSLHFRLLEVPLGGCCLSEGGSLGKDGEDDPGAGIEGMDG